MCYIPRIGYLDRILACRNADLGSFVPWRVAGAEVGRVHRDRVPRLAGVLEQEEGAWLLPGRDFGERSRHLASLVAELAAQGEIRPLTGEFYPVGAPGGPPLLQVDRAAVPWFGVGSSGVHLNGHLWRDGVLHLWLAERSRSKSTYPGHLDNLVAGGQAIGSSALTTLVKECGEEAGIAPQLAAQAEPKARITYVQQDGLGLKADTLQCFDLQLPDDFEPRAVDGEVESFRLLPVGEVAASLRGGDRWKPNSALVVLDFLLRHGALDAELDTAARSSLWQALHGQLP
ncbi:MAG: DUF4743 domain-containing protein [Planctomycetes bacterium]|nr:DUF4743 domain-containing protein [Planctomycetota bacterium]MCB9886511.1 DUF4743 domain-containing protein [Planctomycetota bacterium]